MIRLKKKKKPKCMKVYNTLLNNDTNSQEALLLARLGSWRFIATGPSPLGRNNPHQMPLKLYPNSIQGLPNQ